MERLAVGAVRECWEEAKEGKVAWRLACGYGEAGFSSVALLVFVSCTFVCGGGGTVD